MRPRVTLGIASDIHYAGQAERERGLYESRAIGNPLLRGLARAHRHYLWLRDPFAHNHLVGKFLAANAAADLVIANGDYSCDSAFIGVADEAAFASAKECLSLFRDAAAGRFHATIGDHELGKMSLFGGQGGLRLASLERCQAGLGLRPFWRVELGRYVLLGITSSLIALPTLATDALPGEMAGWEALRAAHFAEIRTAFTSLESGQRVLLFCHDPTALHYLHEDHAIRARLTQVERTILGHLHSDKVLRLGLRLGGMPRIDFLGNTVRRLSSALNRGRCWRDFRVLLCPSLAGLELFKDGGYWQIDLDLAGNTPARYLFVPLPR